MTDNVRPIAPTDPPCASCGAVVLAANRFQLEQHNEGCMQPEIRFRRAEREIAQLREIVHQLVASNNDTVTNQIDLNQRLVALEGRTRGTSEATPDTQRSGEHHTCWRDPDPGLCLRCRAEAADPREPRPDSGTAEP